MYTTPQLAADLFIPTKEMLTGKLSFFVQCWFILVCSLPTWADFTYWSWVFVAGLKRNFFLIVEQQLWKKTFLVITEVPKYCVFSCEYLESFTYNYSEGYLRTAVSVIITIILFLVPYPPLNVEANVTSKDITVRWNYNTQNNEKSITNYRLWHKEEGGTAATKPVKWSDIVNKTGPPILLSYFFRGVLKPYTNYSIGVRAENQYGHKDSAKVYVEMDSAGITVIFNVFIERNLVLHTYLKRQK